MKIYFTLYLIPVVIVALLVFWLALRTATSTGWSSCSSSRGRAGRCSTRSSRPSPSGSCWSRTSWSSSSASRSCAAAASCSSAIVIALVTLGIGKYGQRGAIAIWGSDDWIVSHLIMPLGISYFVFRLLQYVVRLHARRDRGEHPAAAGGVHHVDPDVPGRSAGDVPGLLREAQLRLRPPAVLLRPAAHRPGLLQEGLRGRLRVLDLLRQDHHDASARPTSARTTSAGGGRSPTASSCSCAPTSTSPRTPTSPSASRALFGFRIMENFHLPFLQKNLSDFWRSWHISLSTWCRNNVYFPVFGLTRKVWLGLYASMLTMGLWHYVDLQLAGLGPVSRHRSRRRSRAGSAGRRSPQEGAQEGGPAAGGRLREVHRVARLPGDVPLRGARLRVRLHGEHPPGSEDHLQRGASAAGVAPYAPAVNRLLSPSVSPVRPSAQGACEVQVGTRDGRAPTRGCAFGGGFRQRNPLVLVAAALLRGWSRSSSCRASCSTAAFTAVSEGRLLRITHDDYVHVSVRVQQLKKHPPAARTVYLFGGSGTMECIVSEASLAAADRARRRRQRSTSSAWPRTGRASP